MLFPGGRDEDTLTTLAARLARLDRELEPGQRAQIAAAAGGHTPATLAGALLRAVDPDEVEAASRRLSESDEEQRSIEVATYFSPLAPVEITEANLPHWQQAGATYFVTFRLVDSIPAERLVEWQAEREAWLRRKAEEEKAKRRDADAPDQCFEPRQKRRDADVPDQSLEPRQKRRDAASTLEDQAEYHRLFSGRIESWLDQGHGSLVLNLPECRKIVEDALRHFDGERYKLGEFVVAPNHVHVLVTPRAGQDLSEILHSWKSFTAKEIIKLEEAARRLEGFWDEGYRRKVEREEEKRRDAASTLRSEKRQDAASTLYPAAVRARPVWQKESYDHIVRSPAALVKIEAYIRGHAAWEEKRRDAASTLAERARQQLIAAACAPFDRPALRETLEMLKREMEQVLDIFTPDEVLSAGFDAAAKARAESLVQAFRDYLAQKRAEIAALQILYARPYAQRLTEPMLKELEKKLRDTHATWTEDRLWEAFAVTAPAKVKGRSQPGRFADLVALVRFALEQQPVLEPFADSVAERFEAWLRAKDGESDQRSAVSDQPILPGGRAFSAEQLGWLRAIRDHIATSLSIEAEDFGYAPFAQRGGLGKAHQLFGEQLPKLIEELNEVLAA